MDEAQALDFGIYRVIRRHNRQVQAFLGQVLSSQHGKRLEGGKLSALLEQAFSVSGHEAQAEDKFRLKDLEAQLGLKPGLTHAQKEAILSQAQSIPAIQELVAKYQNRVAAQTSQQTAQLEQYEDTLENLDSNLPQGDSFDLLFQDPAFALHYRLDSSAHALYCAVERFASPFGYQLKRAVSGGQAQLHDVDLLESIPYLLGLQVSRLYRQDQGTV